MARRTDEAQERPPSPSTLGRAHLDCGGDAKASRSPSLILHDARRFTDDEVTLTQRSLVPAVECHLRTVAERPGYSLNPRAREHRAMNRDWLPPSGPLGQRGHGRQLSQELARLLKTCSGATFVDRCDTAIMRVFIDTGLRVSGLAGLRYDPDNESANDVFLAQRRLRIRLKGGDETWVPIGKKSAAALDKYIRARARHSQTSSPWLWLGVQGPQYVAHDGFRYPRHGGAPGRAGGNPERPPAQVPAIIRGQLARGGRVHRRPHAHHGLEDLRHGPRVHRGAQHRASAQRPCASQPQATASDAPSVGGASAPKSPCILTTEFTLDGGVRRRQWTVLSGGLLLLLLRRRRRRRCRGCRRGGILSR